MSDGHGARAPHGGRGRRGGHPEDERSHRDHEGFQGDEQYRKDVEQYREYQEYQDREFGVRVHEEYEEYEGQMAYGGQGESAVGAGSGEGAAEVWEQGAGPGRERTFAPLPPVAGRGFAETWWGQAWLRALGDSALDASQVRAGRRLARAGAVGAISVRPGRITAVVRDREGTPYRADVLVQELDTGSWDRFLDMAAQRAGHVAALLAHDMPGALVEDAADAGVELLPGAGDLEAECGCDAWDHCAHTAALATQLGRVLDDDPFVLFLLRGRPAGRLLGELQRRGAPEPGTEPQGPGAAGVPAQDAWAMGAILPPLPEAPTLGPEAGRPPSYDTQVPPPAGVDPFALEVLAAGAAEEGYALLADALSPGHAHRAVRPAPALPEDAVRLAAVRPPKTYAARLAEGTGRSGDGLADAVRAWRLGGADALSVLEGTWRPDPEEARRARAAVERAWEEDDRPRLRVADGHWTVREAGAQVRVGPGGRWWPYRWVDGRWTPAGAAASDPATAWAIAVAATGTGDGAEDDAEHDAGAVADSYGGGDGDGDGD